MIHSIAHYFEHFGIAQGTVGLEYTFLTGVMMGMLTHPHAKPKDVVTKDCTHILSEMRIVKEPEEIGRIRAAAKVAATGMMAAVEMMELEGTLHGILKEAGHGDHVFGPPIHGVGIEFEESPLPPGHAFFHGEKAPPRCPTSTATSSPISMPAPNAAAARW
jgi:hypothetical protein